MESGHTGTASERPPALIGARSRRRFLLRACAAVVPANYLASGVPLARAAAEPPAPQAQAAADPPAREDWNIAAFSAHGVDQVLAALGLAGPTREDARVQLSAPEIAENGAVVPIEVISDVPDTRRIALLVLRNPNTLAADFRPGARALARIGTRVKLAETTEVLALVASPGGVFLARRTVKVTMGGCGG